MLRPCVAPRPVRYALGPEPGSLPQDHPGSGVVAPWLPRASSTALVRRARQRHVALCVVCVLGLPQLVCVLCCVPAVTRLPQPLCQWPPRLKAARGTPCRSACWCRCSSHNAHAIVPPSPERALMRPGVGQPDLLRCQQHLADKRRPMSWGPAIPICAIRRDGVGIAADHCSRAPGSHNWLCTWEALGPTSVLSHVWRRCRAGCHSWDCTRHSYRCRAVSWPTPHSRH